MESFQDQGIVLSARAHGENGAIVNLLSESQGRVAGYVRGARSGKMRGTLEVGSIVDANWQSRVSDGLGTYTLELCKSYAADYMSDALRLSALQSACALCDEALPEREVHSGIYNGLLVLMEQFTSDVWAAAYVMWEIALLKELGFSLDLTTCAGGGDAQDLAYVSPKSGRAVSREQGVPYKDKLLHLPVFLSPQGGSADERSVLQGLEMTGYFLARWVFAHHSRGIPQSRLIFEERFEKTVVNQELESMFDEQAPSKSHVY